VTSLGHDIPAMSASERRQSMALSKVASSPAAARLRSPTPLHFRNAAAASRSQRRPTGADASPLRASETCCWLNSGKDAAGKSRKKDAWR